METTSEKERIDRATARWNDYLAKLAPGELNLLQISDLAEAARRAMFAKAEELDIHFTGTAFERETVIGALLENMIGGLAKEMKFSTESGWTDPAGGHHAWDEEDPAAQYE